MFKELITNVMFNVELITDNEIDLISKFEWAEDNGIDVIDYELKYNRNTHGRDLIYSVIYSFVNEDDAAAFKLAWL